MINGEGREMVMQAMAAIVSSVVCRHGLDTHGPVALDPDSQP